MLLNLKHLSVWIKIRKKVKIYTIRYKVSVSIVIRILKKILIPLNKQTEEGFSSLKIWIIIIMFCNKFQINHRNNKINILLKIQNQQSTQNLKTN